MLNNHQKKFFNVDWVTVLIYIALCTIGWLSIYATAYNHELSNSFDFSATYGKQLIYIASGLFIGFFILLIDIHLFNALAPIIYIVTTALLIVVLVIGRNVGGNQAWISLGDGFRLQPSEFAKFSTALLLSRYIGLFNPKFKDVKPIFIAGLIVFIPMFLIMRQPVASPILCESNFINTNNKTVKLQNDEPP